MIFAEPSNLWFLIVILLLLPILFLEFRHGKKTMSQLFAMGMQGIFMNLHGIKWFLSRLLLILALAALILALAEPGWGEDYQEEERSGLDLVIVLDVSRSMLVKDVVPDRLTRAREILLGLISQLQGVRIAVVAFKGGGNVVVPLTEDRISVEQALNTLGPDSFSKAGTGLYQGLEAALAAFSTDSLRYRAIVLASDGGDPDPELETLAIEAARLGIPIYSIGLGTEIGGPVLGLSSPEPVLSRLNAENLEILSRISRGQYLALEDASSYNALADLIMGDLNRMAAQGFRIVDIAQYRIFVLLAFILMITYGILGSIRLKGRW